MKSFVKYLVVYLFCFSQPAFAQNKWTGITNDFITPASIHLIESSPDTSIIQFSLAGYFENPVHTPHGTELVISAGKNSVLITEKGMPDLPKIFTSLIIPGTGEMQVRITGSIYHEINEMDIAPSKGHFLRNIQPRDISYDYGEVYNQDEFWPGKLASLGDPFVMRDFKGQTINLFPFQYNPAQRILRVYNEITVELTFSGINDNNKLLHQTSNDEMVSDFRQIYTQVFLNFDDIQKKSIAKNAEEGSLLILAPDEFVEAMRPFVNWKRISGRQTEIFSTSDAGFTASEIKSFVENYYHNNNKLAYLLLVGGVSQIPTNNTIWGDSDQAYGFISGDDQYNEIFVGRFSAQSIADIETQVERVIHYERHIGPQDTWLGTGLGIAANSGQGHYGESDYVHMDFIRDTLLNYSYDKVYQRYSGDVPGIPNTTASQITDDINQGTGIINYCSHGNEEGWKVANYSLNHVNQLSNTAKLPFIISAGCSNGSFLYPKNFAEAWLTATHLGTPTGAVGALMSTSPQPWQPPMTGQDEMIALLAGKGNQMSKTFGGITASGSMKMIAAHGIPGIQTHATWTLFGDPSMMLRTRAPKKFAPEYTVAITMGSSHFNVLTGKEGSRVTLSRWNPENNEVSIVGTAITRNGTAEILLDESLTDSSFLTLAITGYNMLTYTNDSIEVVPPEAPFIVFNSVFVDDSSGNNNRKADYGEEIKLDIGLKNLGLESVEEITTQITTDSEYISVLKDQQKWDGIGGGESVLSTGAFKIKISENAPDNHDVKFRLRVFDKMGNEWISSFQLKIYAPVIVVTGFMVDDSRYGNGNNRPDPGETVEIMLGLHNKGGAPSRLTSYTLLVSNPYLTIYNDTSEPFQLKPGEEPWVSWKMKVHESMPDGSTAELIFYREDDKSITNIQQITIGQVPEVQIGKGSISSEQFPFYNYYKANRTQMLILTDEAGSGEKTITRLGFNILRESDQSGSLKDFSFKMSHTDLDELTDFANTQHATEVFYSDNYRMPDQKGWHFWDIIPFDYDGKSNLMLEISWGLNSSWTHSYIITECTRMHAKMTAFGFTDNIATAPFYDVSNLRPNVYLGFKTKPLPDPMNVEFVVKDNNNEIPINAQLTIGSFTTVINAEGRAGLELYPGTYTVSAHAPGYLPLKDFPFAPGTPPNIDYSKAKDYQLPYEFPNIDYIVNIILTRLNDETWTEYSNADVVEVYPNPVHHQLNLKLPGDYPADIQIIDMLGNVVFSAITAYPESVFDLADLPAGSYILRILSRKEVLTKKIVKY